MGCPVITKVAKASSNSDSIADLVRETDRILLEILLMELVGGAATIRVEIVRGERTTVFNVHCGEESIGRILGARGKNITSIRNIISAIASRKGYRAIVEVPYFSKE